MTNAHPSPGHVPQPCNPSLGNWLNQYILTTLREVLAPWRHCFEVGFESLPLFVPRLVEECLQALPGFQRSD